MMSKKIEINIPVKCKVKGVDHIKATGFVAWFYVGEKRTKFLIQDSRFSDTEKLLVHFASGYSLGSTSPAKISKYRTGHSLTEREAARLTLETIIGQAGLDQLEKVMRDTPAIN